MVMGTVVVVVVQVFSWLSGLTVVIIAVRDWGCFVLIMKLDVVVNYAYSVELNGDTTHHDERGGVIGGIDR